MRAQIFSELGGRLRPGTGLMSVVGLLLGLGLASSASAASLTAWDFAGNTGDETSVNATTVPSGFLTAAISRGGSTDPFANSGAFWDGGGAWSTDGNIQGFFEFSINPDAGTTYTITDIDLRVLVEELGPSVWLLRSDADSFASDVGSFAVARPSEILQTVAVSGAAFENLTSSRVFRLYGIQTSGEGGGLGGTGVDLSINGTSSGGGNGTTTPLPESLPFGALGLAAAVLILIRSRIKASAA